MANFYLVPNWFFGYDLVLELAFAVIALIVSMYAFRIYKLSDQYQSKLFGFAFLFFSISYFIQSFLNFSIISKLNQNICNMMKMQDISVFNALGIYAHMFFFIIGLVTLTYMTLGIKSNKTYSLLLIISLASLFFSLNKLYWFYALSSLFLIYVVIHYIINYLENKQFKTILVLIAFGFLLFGQMHFIFAVDHVKHYILGHFLELVAYILILINLMLVLRK
jgi:hypothetical protein